MAPKIIFEDDYLLVVNKPSGMITTKAITTANQLTLQEWLETRQYPLSGDFERRSGIVHRLDKETSGLIIVAKHLDVFFKLQALFKNRFVQKTYMALVHGIVEPKQGVIDAQVGRLPWNRERFGVLAGGRDARTQYKVLTVFKKDKEKFSLVLLKPKTGRTHQIRIHFKYLGHPVVGDTFYAGRKTSRNDRTWCPRLFLHASEIEFEHPVTHERVLVKAALPVELKNATSVLKKIS